MKQLIGHTSEATAYVVDDYPYGFTLRTQIRYWIETKSKLGQRFVSQTLNPKNGRWNKPKASTYTAVRILGLAEDTGYVTTDGASYYGDVGEWKRLKELYQLDEYQTEIVDRAIKVKQQYDDKKAELVAAGLPAGYPDVVKACITDDIEKVKKGEAI